MIVMGRREEGDSDVKEGRECEGVGEGDSDGKEGRRELKHCTLIYIYIYMLGIALIYI